MDHLRRDIAKLFGLGKTPASHNLVTLDGFDQLEKESALRFYSGKSWSDVLERLRHIRGECQLEEWSVLSSESLSYYLRALLEYLVETLSDREPNEQFVFRFLGELYQVIYMNKGSPFTSAQTLLLASVAEQLCNREFVQERFEYFAEDIPIQAEQLLRELRAYDR